MVSEEDKRKAMLLQRERKRRELAAEIERTHREYAVLAEETRSPISTYDEIIGSYEGRPPTIPCPLCSELGYTPGSLTLYAGINGHGKSLLTGQIVQHLAYIGQKSCVLSFEMEPWQTMKRMFRQVYGKDITDQREYVKLEAWLRWNGDYVLVHDMTRAVTADAILKAYEFYAVKRKIQHFWVDNLMAALSSVSSREKFEKQDEFATNLKSIAVATGTCCHLVCHIRKVEDEITEVGKFDIKGSGGLTDAADSVVILQRSKDKELNPGMFDDSVKPDSTLWLCKNRHGEREVKAKLWFNPASRAFSTGPDRIPPMFVPEGFWKSAASQIPAI